MRNAVVKDVLIDAAAIISGCFIMALGMDVFTIPNNIAPGGLSGLATAIAHLTGWPVGVQMLIFNIPLMILCAVVFGIKPLVKTIVATVFLSAMIDLLTVIKFSYTGNVLLSAVLGGAMIGLGLGIMFARGITTGGTDLIAMLLKHRFPNFTMGRLMLVVDAIVVAVAVFAFQDIEVALYSGVALFCASKAVDTIQQGMDYAKVVYIITTKPEEIMAELAKEIDRGMTLLPAKGGYTREDKTMVMTVVGRNQVAQTLQIARALDPKAFIILSNATEVHGEGFKEIAKQ